MGNWFELMTGDEQVGVVMVGVALAMLVYKALNAIVHIRIYKKNKTEEKSELAKDALVGFAFWFFMSVIAIAALLFFSSSIYLKIR